jgi:GYF domain 2/Domain of unknown function (DUF4190)
MEENNWYYNENGKPTGPVTLADLRQLFTAGRVNAGTLVWHQTLVQWTPAGQVPELLPPTPPPIMPMATPPNFQSPFNSVFPPPTSSSHHGMAVTAFVLSLVGLCIPCAGFLVAIPGLILGIIALSGMSRTHNRDGHGLALAAVIIAAIACLCHGGLWLNMAGPPRYWHYDFHRQIPWNGWNT